MVKDVGPERISSSAPVRPVMVGMTESSLVVASRVQAEPGSNVRLVRPVRGARSSVPVVWLGWSGFWAARSSAKLPPETAAPPFRVEPGVRMRSRLTGGPKAL
jgi:hypothetical protein